MIIKKHIVLVFSIISIISCKTTAQENEAYKVLDAVFENLDNKLLERLKKHPDNKYVVAETKAKLNNPVYIDPKFSHLLASRFSSAPTDPFAKVQHDFWPIIYIPTFHGCTKNFQIENLQLIKDSMYYVNQIKKAPDSIDLKKVTHKRVRHYKTELEEIKHIKHYENWIKRGIDSVTLHTRKRIMLGEENKLFRISYPIFSKNGKYTLVYIEKEILGLQLWILEKKDGQWIKCCVSYIGTIN